MAANMYRLHQFTTISTGTIWYVLESSTDGGQTWASVKSSSSTYLPTNGVVAGLNLTNMSALMNAYHAAATMNTTDGTTWTDNGVVAGPV